MTNLRSMNIRTKLVITFLLVVVIASGSGLLGISATSNIATSSEMMYHQQVVPISYLLVIAESFQRTRVYAQKVILASDPKEYKKIRNGVQGIYKKCDSLNALYQTSIPQNDKGREWEIFQHYLSCQRQFRQSYEEIMQLAEQGLRDSAVYSLNAGRGYKGAYHYHFAIDSLVKFKSAAAFQAKESNKGLFLSLREQLSGYIFASICIAVVLSLWLARRVSKPLDALVRGANSFTTNGHSDHLIAESEMLATGDDEIGKLASSFHTMVLRVQQGIQELQSEKASVERRIEEAIQQSELEKEYLARSIDAILRSVRAFSEGDLTQRISLGSDDEIEQLCKGYSGAVEKIRQMVENVCDAVNNTTLAGTEIMGSTEQMAVRMREQLLQTENIAISIEQMLVSMKDNAQHTNAAAEEAARASDDARRGGEIVREAIESMNVIMGVMEKSALRVLALGKSSEHISEIIGVVRDIAEQSNLLALNASIEAARAGDAGRGFAVVAEEVRKLSGRTQEATKEISQMVDTIQHETQQTVEVMTAGSASMDKSRETVERAREALERIIGRATRVSGVIEQTATASEEQATVSAEMARRIKSIRQATEDVAEGTMQIAQQAETLERLTKVMKTGIQQFKIVEVELDNRQMYQETAPTHRRFPHKLLQADATYYTSLPS